MSHFRFRSYTSNAAVSDGRQFGAGQPPPRSSGGMVISASLQAGRRGARQVTPDRKKEKRSEFAMILIRKPLVVCVLDGRDA